MIGLDAMEWTLVRRWVHEGKLPAFRRLLEQGAGAELSSTAATLPDTVWSAINSGTNPMQFAKYLYVQYNAASGDLCMIDDESIGAYWFSKPERIFAEEEPREPSCIPGGRPGTPC